MSTRNHYDEDFKRTLVELYHNGKTQASLIKEYGISQSALTKWIKQYSTVETDNGEVLTAKQVKVLPYRLRHLPLSDRWLLSALFLLHQKREVVLPLRVGRRLITLTCFCHRQDCPATA